MELKKINHTKGLSQETPCFKAELWDDGKHIGFVENRGGGGGNTYWPKAPYSHKDVGQYDNIKTESKIFVIVLMATFVKENQSKGFVLQKGGELYVQKFPVLISVLKKRATYNSFKKKRLEAFKKDGFEVLNPNL
jgi:hypothetical protein